MGSSVPHLSDIDGDSAARASSKAVIGEVPELHAVDQTAAHLSDSCHLPSDPESRLHRLKTFPGSLSRTTTPDALQMNRARTLHNPPLNPTEPHGLIPAKEGREAETFTLENEAPPPVPVDSSRGRSPSPQRKRCCFCFCWRRKAQRREGKGDDASAAAGRAVAIGGAEEAGEGDAGNRGDGGGGTDKTNGEELK
ncbi:hypothetical protein OPV22_014596 [Ensete ventricosum]|uniref:Uncharacterized protein n=1 Tax=Ensete ventricosum TaxID=4639 RepID=A0AAV8R7Z4_ENSVE|nr:hypothetical protein OPV22_014596 [Ensete ventricosum]